MRDLLDEVALLDCSNLPLSPSRAPEVSEGMIIVDPDHWGIGSLIAIVTEVNGGSINGITYSRSHEDGWRWSQVSMSKWFLPPPDLHDRIWAEHCAEQLTGC